MPDLINNQREAILSRDGHMCQMCGARSGESWESDPSRSNHIQVGSRFLAFAAEELDTEDLCALCDECDEGLQEVRLRQRAMNMVDSEAHVASIHQLQPDEQVKVLRTLMSKFPDQARSFLV
jgi:hypothetical protein